MADVRIPGGPTFGGGARPPGVPSDPTGQDWRGPPGPQGPQGIPGPPTPLTGVGGNVMMTAEVGYTQTVDFGSVPTCMVCTVNVESSASDANIAVELWNGSIGGGDLVYQATGINMWPYRDYAPWFFPGGGVACRVTNIDGIASSISVSMRIAPYVSSDLI